MHKAVTVVIPGAVNKHQVDMNTETSNLDEISSLMIKINSIYENLIKPDVHHLW